MTVLRNLPEQLILAHAPWHMGGFLIACIVACCAAGTALLFSGEYAGLLTVLLLTSIPGALFALTIKRDQVIFDVVAQTITVQRQTLWGYTCRIYPLGAFKGAHLQEIADTSRPVIQIAQDGSGTIVPLIQSYMSGNSPCDCVALINAWHMNWRRSIHAQD